MSRDRDISGAAAATEFLSDPLSKNSFEKMHDRDMAQKSESDVLKHVRGISRYGRDIGGWEICQARMPFSCNSEIHIGAMEEIDWVNSHPWGLSHALFTRKYMIFQVPA